MTRDTKLATYWTAGTIAGVIVIALIAWMLGMFEMPPK